MWLANPGPELDKRQSSMQVSFTPEDDDLRVSVLYRGMDKQISVDERQSYHKSVDVY